MQLAVGSNACHKFVCLMFSCLYFARWHSINSTFFFSKPKPSFRRLGALVNLALSLRKELYLLYNKVQTSQKQESQIRPWQKTNLQSSEEKNMEEERHDDGNNYMYVYQDVHIIIVYWWWCAGLCCIQKLQNCTSVLQSANGPKAYCKSNLIVS